jgi:hypothetical protein
VSRGLGLILTYKGSRVVNRERIPILLSILEILLISSGLEISSKTDYYDISIHVDQLMKTMMTRICNNLPWLALLVQREDLLQGGLAFLPHQGD